MRITEPGFYEMSLADYLADPCPAPALSTSVVEALMTQTPSHARRVSPQLSKRADKATTRGDLGSAIHARVSGIGEVVYADYQFENWKKKAAQEFQDDAQSKGQIPLLEKQRFGVEMAAEKALKLLRETFGPGKFEQTMCFRVGDVQLYRQGGPPVGVFVPGVWARGRADYLPDDAPFDVDLKSCDNANPAEWARMVLARGPVPLQAGIRSLGHIALGRPRKMVWLAVEIDDPWEPSLIGMDPAYESFAQEQVIRAAKIWRRCLETGVFPGYPKDIHWTSPPAYAVADFETRKGIEQ